MTLPLVPTVETIQERLPLIFPAGIAHKGYLVREICAKTIFVMFYTGAIDGTGRRIRPDQVTKMNDAQATRLSTEERLAWSADSLKPGKMKDVEGRWYAANTRESIRDETLRTGLVPTGAVVERTDLPTTSSAPRYCLDSSFAALFSECLNGEDLAAAIHQWQDNHLTAAALARLKLVKRSRVGAGNESSVLVTLPNGEIRQMAPGPSSLLTRAVVQEFAVRFLQNPALVFLSQSSTKVIAQDDDLAQAIGLRIDAAKNLPDIILADLASDAVDLVVVEVVVTDGAITTGRKQSLASIFEAAGFDARHVAFVTAFEDRGANAYRKLCSDLAWGSYVWFESEPDNIVHLKDVQRQERRILSNLSNR